MKILIGYTGLVGKTLTKSIQFDQVFNSSNIKEYLNTDKTNAELYLACLPAEKWKANQDPSSDLVNIQNIFGLISQFKYSKVVLISTIDVYSESPLGSTETTVPSFEQWGYGSNRYLFEQMVMMLQSPIKQVFRLPGLFGEGLKKNLIYDLIHNHRIEFIDPSSTLQWYDLSNLAQDITQTLTSGVFNLFPEPLHTKEIIALFDYPIEDLGTPKHNIMYDFKTKHTSTGYIKNKNQVLIELNSYINETRNKLISI